MLTSTVRPSLWKKSNIFIVCSKGLVFECDMCKLTIKDRICLCNTCKKCLHLECAGVEIQSKINACCMKQTVLPAPEELPKSCPDCLKSIRSVVGNNSNTIRIPESVVTDQERSTVGSSNNPMRWLTSQLESYTTGAVSNIHRIDESTIHPAHKLSEDKYDDCLDHINIQGHELEKKHNGTFYSCFGCKVKSFGPHHACRNSSCSFHLHEDCKSPHKFIIHPFFPNSSFAFAASPKHHTKVNCNACGMDVNGYLYENVIGTNKEYLHPCCANLPRQIICGERKATMVLQQNATSNCSYCRETTMMVGNKKTSQIWSYVSRSDNIHLHVPCIINMLSDLTKNNDIGRRTSVLTISHQKIDQVIYSMTKYEFQIAAAADAKKRWETEFKKIIKYAKIALGAIIATVLGDPRTFIINCTVTFKS